MFPFAFAIPLVLKLIVPAAAGFAATKTVQHLRKTHPRSSAVKVLHCANEARRWSSLRSIVFKVLK